MKYYDTTVEIMLRFNLPVQAPDEEAAEVRAGYLLDRWLRNHKLDQYELIGERGIFVDEDEEGE